jgi:hypothetical protein
MIKWIDRIQWMLMAHNGLKSYECKDGIPQWGSVWKGYMAQPKGFVMEGIKCMGCRLKKSVYGLKQASRQ